MPLYDYQCKKCGEAFEYLQKFSDPPMTKCEACGGKLAKQLTAPAFHLKGGGWYADGYASKKAEATAKGGDKEGAADGKSAKTDDKAAKPEKKKRGKGTEKAAS